MPPSARKGSVKAEVDDGTLWSTLRDHARRAGAAASNAQRLGDGQLGAARARHRRRQGDRDPRRRQEAQLPDRSVRDRNGFALSILRQPKPGWHAVTSMRLRASGSRPSPAPRPSPALAEAFDAFADRCVRCADVELKAEVKAEGEVEAEAEAVEELWSRDGGAGSRVPPRIVCRRRRPELDLEAEEAPEEESDDEVVVMAAEQPAVEAAGEAADPYDFLGPKIEKMKVSKVVPRGRRPMSPPPPPPPPPPVEEEEVEDG